MQDLEQARARLPADPELAGQGEQHVARAHGQGVPRTHLGAVPDEGQGQERKPHGGPAGEGRHERPATVERSVRCRGRGRVHAFEKVQL